MTFNKIDYFKILILCTIILSYFLGFALRENAAGGGEHDFIDRTWPAIQGFRNDFIYSLKNYGIFGEGALPTFHILNAFLNPFSKSQLTFQLSITIISALNFFIFENILRNKFRIELIDSLLFSSIILLLPLFRTSAFWGLTENFGWLFLLLAIKFYLKVEYLIIKKILNYQVVINIFVVCFFSSLALYTRQYLIFFPIFLVLDFLFVKKNFKAFLILIVFFIFFSLPGFILIYLWGGLYDAANFDANLTTYYHHPRNILKNLPFFLSFFAFYLIPFVLIEIKAFGFGVVFKKYYLSFFIIFFIMIALNSLSFFDYLKNIDLGGGVFLKLNHILFKENLIFFILTASIGFSLLYEIIKENYRINIILFMTLLIFCFPKFILQEYYEPLVLILFLFLFSQNIRYIFDEKRNFSIFITVFYFTGYLLGSIYYRHFYL